VLELQGPAETGAGAGAPLSARYDIVVVSSPAARPFQRSTRVAFLPRYTLVNASASAVWWRQAGAVPVALVAGWGAGGTAPPVRLPPFSSTPVWWPFDGGARAIQISPEGALGGWSAPIPLELPAGRSAVAKPVLVPHGAPDGDTLSMLHTVAGPALVGGSVWGARLAAARAGGEATVLTLCGESPAAAPLRPPPTMPLSVSPKESTSLVRAMEADRRAEEGAAEELLRPPQVALINHSGFDLAVWQKGAAAFRESGEPMGEGEAAAEAAAVRAGGVALAAAAARPQAAAPPSGLPLVPAGAAFAAAVTFAPAGACVPLGLTAPAHAGAMRFSVVVVDPVRHRKGEEVEVDCSTVDERWSLSAPEGAGGAPARPAVVLVVRLTRAGLRLVAMNDDSGPGGSAPPPPAWVRVGGENDRCEVEAGARVRYGAPGKWLEKVAAGPFKASNAFFGGDPAPGVLKSVEALRAAAPPPPPRGGAEPRRLTSAMGGAWQDVGEENETFPACARGTRVRFGAPGAGWVEKVVDADGGFKATLAFFGADPAKGMKKRVEVFKPGVVATGTVSEGAELEAEGLADALQYGVGVDALEAAWEARRQRRRQRAAAADGALPLSPAPAPAPPAANFSARVWDAYHTVVLAGLRFSLVGATEELLHAALEGVAFKQTLTASRHTKHLDVSRLQLDDQGHAAGCPVVLHSGRPGKAFLSLSLDSMPRPAGAGGGGLGAAVQGLHVLNANLALDKVRLHLTHSFISRALETVKAMADSAAAADAADAAAAAAGGAGAEAAGAFSPDELALTVASKAEDAAESGAGAGAGAGADAAPPPRCDPASDVRAALLEPPPPPPRHASTAPAVVTDREAALALSLGGDGGGGVPLGGAEAFLSAAQASPLQLQLDYTPPTYKPTRGDPLHDFLKTAFARAVPLLVARTIRNVVENLQLQGASLSVAVPGTAAPGRFLSLGALTAELKAAAAAQIPDQVTGILRSAAGAGRRINAAQAQVAEIAEAAARGDALGVAGGAAKTAANVVGVALETGTGAVSTALGAGALGFKGWQDALAWKKKGDDGKLGAHDVMQAAGDGGLQTLASGVTQVGKGFYKGLKGVVMDPIRGAQAQGVGGFFKGVGTGVVGVVVRPMAGLLGGVQTVVSGAHNAVHEAFDYIGVDHAAEDAVPPRVRPPRALYSPAGDGGGGGSGGGGGGGGAPSPASPPAAAPRVVRQYDDFHAKVLIALVQLAQLHQDRALAGALQEPLVAVAGGPAGGRAPAAPFRDGSTALLTTGHLIHFSGGQSEELALRSLVPLGEVSAVEVVAAAAGASLVVHRAGAPAVELQFAEGADGRGLRAAKKLLAAIEARAHC